MLSGGADPPQNSLDFNKGAEPSDPSLHGTPPSDFSNQGYLGNLETCFELH